MDACSQHHDQKILAGLAKRQSVHSIFQVPTSLDYCPQMQQNNLNLY